ncbi:hypothetical protein [Pseudoxanthomonas sacheonensis]|uniref:hypothetical protein n=1 Tax=Pseudoxanthomonas sacheonensis TaxID=443615 RepID=UPI00286A6FB7|nr:hypothetical protein [Pseudoxanthomonas sacheonensis]
MPAALLVLSAALMPWSAMAKECPAQLGRGWPPGTANYGGAVERLFDGQASPALSLVWLPRSGKETGLALLPGSEGMAWALRYSEADERVYHWGRDALELKTEQTPRQSTVPIPAALAQRLMKVWGDSLRQAVPEAAAATFHEGDVLSAVVDGVRFSGPVSECGPLEQILEQAGLLIEASDEKESKRERRWAEIDASLQTLQQSLAGAGG